MHERDVELEAFEGAFVAERRRVPDAWNDVTRTVIGCAMRVHSALGPGLPEKLYAEALRLELGGAGVCTRREVVVSVPYQGTTIGTLRLDLVVEDFLIVELKAIDQVHDVHLAQLVGYLRAAHLPLGLLINFSTLRLKDGIYRRLNASALPP